MLEQTNNYVPDIRNSVYMHEATPKMPNYPENPNLLYQELWFFKHQIPIPFYMEGIFQHTAATFEFVQCKFLNMNLP
jgi:hypothetical protein